MPRLPASTRRRKLPPNSGAILKPKADIHSSYGTNSIYHSRRKKTKIVKDEIICLISSSPCFWSDVPRRKRSNITNNSVRTVSIAKKKLGSGDFGYFFENLWTSFPEDKKSSCAYLDCLWFSLYRNSYSKAKVLTWIKKEQIFSKKYVFVPIVCWDHWSLLILCNFGESFHSTSRTRCMLLLDSLEMANPKRIEPEIRKFVRDIYEAAGRPETRDIIRKIPFLVPKVPQQRDDEECGNFVLYFIHLFMKDLPENFSMDGYPYFMEKNWFTSESLDSFCKELSAPLHIGGTNTKLLKNRVVPARVLYSTVLTGCY